MTREETDLGRCARCGGRVAATHMLTKTYPLDEAGGWLRRFADFVEDVVVVCAECGAEPPGTVAPAGTFVPAGSFGGDGTSFAFVPSHVDGKEPDGDG